VNNKRPVNLDLRTIKLPITAYTSILHRASGIILFLGMVLMLYALSMSLESPVGFMKVKAFFANPLVKFIMWGLLSSLLYHMVAGVRHLLMDAGIGEELESGKMGSKIVIAISAVLIISAGVWIW